MASATKNCCISASVISRGSIGMGVNFSGTLMIHMTDPLLMPHSFRVFVLQAAALSPVSYLSFICHVWSIWVSI